MKKAARKKKETIVEKVEEAIVEAVIPEVKEQKKVKKIIGNKPLLIGIIVVLIVVIGAAGLYIFLYIQKDAASPVAANGQLSSEQIKALVHDVGKLVVLPDGEVPTIATVTDVEKLASQPFFKSAQNGDKVLLYGSTKEAILYRPSIGKIIKMAPVNSTDIATPSPSLVPQANVGSSPTVTPVAQKIKVIILNSTKEAGLARKASALFDKEKYEIVSTGNATGEYDTTTVSVVNKQVVNDTSSRTITALLANTKAAVKSLPSGENTPTGADVVIILGADFSESY